MDKENKKISEGALTWVKNNKKSIIEHFSKGVEYVSDTAPVTLMMAGSPGAGKTEISKRLIQRFNEKPIRIDADEVRSLCDGYTGSNANLFQRAANKGVNILYDHALNKKINVILDGTFAYSGVEDNISRSLKRGRKVEIFYVFQDPIQSWEFTKKREVEEYRNDSKEVFIDTFFRSQENIKKVKTIFGDLIEINLIIKDFEKGLERLKLDVSGVDNFINNVYSKENLEKLLL